MNLGLGGKIALVTGASRGLGRAMAEELAREGARVVLAARGEAVERVAGEIAAETGAETLALRADVTRPEDAARMVAAATERFGGLDILIPNAGGPAAGTFESLPEEAWRDGIELSLLSVVRLVKVARPHLEASSAAAILTVTSAVAKQPLARFALSGSIRLAVIGLTKSLSRELAPRGIRVNSLLPGWTATELVAEVLEGRAAASGRTVEEEAAEVAATIPLGRLGRPEEIGRVAAFLCSPAASYLTGAMVQVDGGEIHAPF